MIFFRHVDTSYQVLYVSEDIPMGEETLSLVEEQTLITSSEQDA